MKRARSFMALVLALCLCTALSACGDKEEAGSRPEDAVPQDSAPQDSAAEDTVQSIEISLEQIEGYTAELWKTDISDADASISDKLGINTDNKEFFDSADGEDADFWLIHSQTYTYDLTDSPAEVMGIPCKEVSIYAPYDKEDKDKEKPVESITFELGGDSSEDNYAKLSSELVKAYGEGTEGKSFINEFIYWTPAGKDMIVTVYPPSEDSSKKASGLALKFESIED